MKIVIAPDSFKGTLSSAQATSCIEEGIKKIFPEAWCVNIPIADGGEGTLCALVSASAGKMIGASVKDPLGREIEAFWGMMGDGETAVIEMAAASGLPLLGREERNPLVTTSWGTGQLIQAALDHGVRKIIMGIGGSATVDGGAGMAQALGVRMKDPSGHDISPGGMNLEMLDSIDISGMDGRISSVQFQVACDVDNPLLGEKGAARVYGPQKGATPEMVEILESGLSRFAAVIRKETGIEVSNIPGAGAAGGMGAALLAFFKARLVPGFELIQEALPLEREIADADLVITGEGKLDEQTLFGKAPAGVARLARKHGVPVVMIGGMIGEKTEDWVRHGMGSCFSALERNMTEEDIFDQAGPRLRRCSERIAAAISIGMSLERKRLQPTEPHFSDPKKLL